MVGQEEKSALELDELQSLVKETGRCHAVQREKQCQQPLQKEPMKETRR